MMPCSRSICGPVPRVAWIITTSPRGPPSLRVSSSTRLCAASSPLRTSSISTVAVNRSVVQRRSKTITGMPRPCAFSMTPLSASGTAGEMSRRSIPLARSSSVSRTWRAGSSPASVQASSTPGCLAASAWSISSMATRQLLPTDGLEKPMR
jgi:hypothetical protein